MSFYTKEKLEFLTIAVETSKFLENVSAETKNSFVTKTTKLLPLLYLKTLMVQPEELSDDEPERFVTEMDYEQVRNSIANILEESDDYLDSFDENMAYSETTIYATISEDIADIYQSLKDFARCCQQADDATSEVALSVCIDDFRNHWGGRLLGALRALHVVLQNLSDDTTDNAGNEDEE